MNGFSPDELPDYFDQPTDEIIKRWRELNTKFSTYYSDPDEVYIQYRTTSGDQYETSIRDIAFHTINHTTFYRSQIIMMVRMLGYEVEDTDFIFYQRNFT